MRGTETASLTILPEPLYFPQDHVLTVIAFATTGQKGAIVRVTVEFGCKTTVERVAENAMAVVVVDVVRDHVTLTESIT